MPRLFEDVRYALRLLGKSRAFAAVAIATLGLGIGATTALFSVVHTVLLRPLPFSEPDQLYWVWSRHTSTDRYPFSLPEFCDYRDQNHTLQAVAGFANWSGTLVGDGPAERLPGLRVSANMFEMLGARAAVGRTLRADDDVPGRPQVVVLSHGLWQRRFGGDPAVVGRSLVLSGEPYDVVGVLEPSFVFPIRDIELAIPLRPDADPFRHNRDSTNFIRAVGRARPGISRAQIADDLGAIGLRLQREFAKSYERKRGVMVVRYREELTRGSSQALWGLLATVGLLLLIACANLANLMLARAIERRREMAIRKALGAGSMRLARQLLTESALLALGGAALGLLLAYLAVPVLMASSPANLPRAKEVAIRLPVLLFTLATTVLAALGFGLVPARRAARANPSEDLKAGGRSAGTADGSRLRGLIVATQVALMMVLLTQAGLLSKSFREVMRLQPGFDRDVLSVRLSLPRKDYSELAKVSHFYRTLEARVAALAGVVSVGAVNHVPLNGALASADYKPADRPPAADAQIPTAQYRMVTPDYFATMRIPLLAGRAFGDDDREGGAPVAIVSQALVRQSFQGRSPLGRQVLVGDNPAGFRSLEIVGVAGDVRHASLEEDPLPHLYVPYHQTNPNLLVWLAATQYLVVRTSGDARPLGDAVRRELAQVDPNVAAADIRTSGDYVDAAAASRRFSLLLLTAFAGLALGMAAVGIYGVVAYGVAQRTRETGVRLALGAGVADIVGLVLGEGLRRTLQGIGAGLAAALAASHALRSLLYGVAATDLPTYAAVIAVLVGVTVAACLLPAWRAARVNPLLALHRD